MCVCVSPVFFSVPHSGKPSLSSGKEQNSSSGIRRLLICWFFHACAPPEQKNTNTKQIQGALSIRDCGRTRQKQQIACTERSGCLRLLFPQTLDLAKIDAFDGLKKCKCTDEQDRASKRAVQGRATTRMYDAVCVVPWALSYRTPSFEAYQSRVCAPAP